MRLGHQVLGRPERLRSESKLIRNMPSDPHSQAGFLQPTRAQSSESEQKHAFRGGYPPKNDVLDDFGAIFRGDTFSHLLLLMGSGAPGGQTRRVDL